MQLRLQHSIKDNLIVLRKQLFQYVSTEVQYNTGTTTLFEAPKSMIFSVHVDVGSPGKCKQYPSSPKLVIVVMQIGILVPEMLIWTVTFTKQSSTHLHICHRRCCNNHAGRSIIWNCYSNSDCNYAGWSYK